MTKISGMAKVLVLALIFILMSLTTGLEVKAVDDGTLPDQGTVPMSPTCVLFPGKCYGKVYSIHVGDRTYQAVSFTLLLGFGQNETAQVEINDIVYTSEFQQGGFVIEADNVDTAFFKIFNAVGELIYIADWTREDLYEKCFAFEYFVHPTTVERYGVVEPGHSVMVGNRTYDIRNQSFIFAIPEGFNSLEFVRETVSGEVVRCYGIWTTLAPFPYAMKYTNYLTTVNK